MATPEQIALVIELLPSAAIETEAAGGYGWTEEIIAALMDSRNLSPTEVVRHFWLQRVNETAEYLDAGKPLTQIHRQAVARLEYWDAILRFGGKEATSPVDEKPRAPMSFGEIERPWNA